MSTPVDIENMSPTQLKEYMAQLQKENADLLAAKAAKVKPLTLKVGDKGGVCVYGLNNRFPVTLYSQQWERLIAFAPEITKFMAANASKLKTKD